MSRRGGGLGKAILLSTVVHVALIGGIAWMATRTEGLPPMRVYAVNIVSPPPQAAGEFNPDPGETDPPEEEFPAEIEPEVEPESEPDPAPAPPPPPAPAPPERQAPRPTPPPPPSPPRETPPAREEPRQEPARQSTGARPDPTSTGGQDIDLQLEGVRCPSEEYCANIVLQIDRYFRSPGGGAAGVADVYFVINRNGSITDLRLISSTGGASFRLAVMEAVEQAGLNRAFGALPAVYQSDRLPIRFSFSPRR